jgi:hypothetical protein
MEEVQNPVILKNVLGLIPDRGKSFNVLYGGNTGPGVLSFSYCAKSFFGSKAAGK